MRLPVDFVTFSLIIDDIVFADGRTAMGMLGGGGPQSAFGMKLWTEAVGLVSGVGTDLPPSARTWLAQMEIDTRGLRTDRRWPTPRAWQLLEADGRRTQVWRVPGPAIGAQLGRHVGKLPAQYRAAQGFHLGVHPEEPGLEFIAALRRGGAWVSVEPFREPQRPLSAAEVRALVSAGQIFSPNLSEAQALLGPGESLALAHQLAEAGAQIVALRQGRQGATVFRADTGEAWYIPALPATVVDPTGAGNAFCGGFLVGWVQTGDLRLAGLNGAVAASFLVAQVGLPQPAPTLAAEARQRRQALATLTRRLD